MTGAREVELMKLLNAVVASASKAEGGDSSEEGRAVDALKALAKEPVTADLLSKTAAGKKVKKLCKHASAAIKAAATATVDAWMERVRQEQKAKPALAPAPAAAAAAATGQSQEANPLDSQPSASGRPALSSGISIGLDSQDSQGLSSAGSLPSSSKLTTRPARCGDMTRDKIRDLLADALALAANSETLADPAEVAVQVEEAMFQLSGEVNQKYKAKYRTLGFNLKDAKNPDLRSKVGYHHRLNACMTPRASLMHSACCAIRCCIRSDGPCAL
eukprot:365014-Chlamydomonas_euryale.AAC.15